MKDFCRACGGDGFIDEPQARRIRHDLGDARVDMCPICCGSGVTPPFIRIGGLIMVLAIIATLALGLGAMLGFLVWGLHSLQALAG